MNASDSHLGSLHEYTAPVAQPLVSVLTPVYNNDQHLAEAIESVLAQTYSNWDYTIVNNCSNDDSKKIALQYAERDSRIRVVDTPTFLNVDASHNFALRQTSPKAKYSKIVFGDDWIYPQCIEEMVAVAEAHPSVAMVGAYAIEGNEVKCDGLSPLQHEHLGSDVARRYLLNDMFSNCHSVFGSSNNLLFRSDIVRGRDPFFDETHPHADRDLNIALLRKHNYGFVPQVLTFTRLRKGSLTDKSNEMHSYISGSLRDLRRHGGEFLTPTEYEGCLKRLVAEYYNFLAVNLVLKRRDPAFWNYHAMRLAECGIKFSRLRLAAAILARAGKAAINPGETFEKLLKRKP
jgi:glycosyltransferase involved in cell wall biosynthesis